MTETTRTIPLDQATSGMVLAKAVLLQGGNILLPGGTLLSENHLTNLKKRGVEEIAVVAPGEESATLTSAQREALEEATRLQVQHLFRKSGTDATTQALLRTVIEYRLEKIK